MVEVDPMTASADIWQQIAAGISLDPGQRGVKHLLVPGELESAARSLCSARSVLIATGFSLGPGAEAETDGPPGAIELARGLSALGANVSFVSDASSSDILKKAGLVPITTYPADAIDVRRFDHLVAIERPGRAKDGRYYSMRGRDLSAWVGPVDELFLSANQQGIATIGVGDGGNEVGMGRVIADVERFIPEGQRIASTVRTDRLVVAGTSNWGAWGLLAGLSCLARQNLLPTDETALADVADAVRAGCVDGVSGRREATVDGLSETVYLSPLAELRRVVNA
jgi:hypothetical protein